jgi:hypothetical protein
MRLTFDQGDREWIAGRLGVDADDDAMLAAAITDRLEQDPYAGMSRAERIRAKKAKIEAARRRTTRYSDADDRVVGFEEDNYLGDDSPEWLHAAAEYAQAEYNHNRLVAGARARRAGTGGLPPGGNAPRPRARVVFDSSGQTHFDR